MITCVVDYEIDPAKIDAFEKFAGARIALVNRHGRTHHGYFLPGKGSSDRALAPFSFPSLARYEEYRSRFGRDPDIDADLIPPSLLNRRLAKDFEQTIARRIERR